MTLRDELIKQAEAGAAKIPAEILEEMKKANFELAETSIDKKIVSVWEKFPEITLPNADGQEVSISKLLEKWPLVISFYRGGWCPYCNLELKALQNLLPEFEKVNAQIVAISPETPDSSIETKNKNEIKFEVLSDIWNVLSKELKLTFNLKKEIIDIYTKFGLDVEKHNGNKLFELPLPATYVVGTDWIIKFAQAQTDYTKRTEPSDILKVLEEIK